MKNKLFGLLLVVLIMSASTTFASDNLSGKVFTIKKMLPAVKASAVTKPKAIDFIFEVDGKEMKFSEVTKGKIVFLNFWGTWCPPCRREIPDIIQLQKEMGKDVIVIGLASERNPNDIGKVKKFVKAQKINYPNFMSNKAINMYYGSIAYGANSSVKYVPTTYVIGKNGYVLDYKNGAHSKKDFIDWIKKLTK